MPRPSPLFINLVFILRVVIEFLIHLFPSGCAAGAKFDFKYHKLIVTNKINYRV